MSTDLSLYELVSAVRDSPGALMVWAVKREKKSGILGMQRVVDEAWYAGRHPLAMLWVVDIVRPEHTNAIRTELGTHLRRCPVTSGRSDGPLGNGVCKRCAGIIRHMLRETPQWDVLMAYSLAWQAKVVAAKTEAAR